MGRGVKTIRKLKQARERALIELKRLAPCVEPADEFFPKNKKQKTKPIHTYKK